MEGILVFNLSNDLLYQRFNDDMKKRVHDLAIEQGLIENVCKGIFLSHINSKKLPNNKIIFFSAPRYRKYST